MAEDYDTHRPSFRRLPNGSLVSDDATEFDLTIPAAISSTGQDQPIEIPANTIVLTMKDEIALRIANVARHDPLFANVLSNLSVQTGFPLGRLTDIFSKANVGNIGPKSRTVIMSDHVSGNVIEVVGSDFKEIEIVLSGRPAQMDNLQIPDYIRDGYRSFVTLHEMVHSRDPAVSAMEERSGDMALLISSEARADEEALRQFSPEFATYIYDARALNALNTALSGGPKDNSHSSHITPIAREDGSIDPAEYQNIADAPDAIWEATRVALKKQGVTDEQIRNLKSSDEGRYAAFRLGRQLSIYDDIPYGNAFVDRYLAAAEHVFKPEVTDPRYSEALAQELNIDIKDFPVGEEPYEVYAEYDATDLLKEAHFSETDAELFLDNPAQRYGIYKMMLDSGAYANDPETTAYLQRYVEGAEAVYGQDYLSNVSQTYIQSLFDFDVKAHLEELNADDESETAPEVNPDIQKTDPSEGMGTAQPARFPEPAI